MTAELIDGKLVSAKLRERVAREVAEWVATGHRRPGLAAILVGDDPGSASLVASKRRACEAVGIADFHRQLEANVSQDEAAAVIAELAADPAVSGILLQLPVPERLDGAALIELIPPEQDVDGLTAVSVGRLVQGQPGLRPCTPLGVIELLDFHKVQIEGATAVVVGRSQLVGRPTAQLLLERNATVTSAHTHTADLAGVCASADILIVAAGQTGLIGPDHVKAGAAVIDVGMNRNEAGLCGDVDFEAVSAKAGLITPVPGGVGPMTIAELLANTLRAAKMQAEI